MKYVISESEKDAVVNCLARAVHPSLTFASVNDILKMLQSLELLEDKKDK